MTLFGRTGTNNVAACALSAAAESYTTTKAPTASLLTLGRPAGLGRDGCNLILPIERGSAGEVSLLSPPLLPGPHHRPAPRCQRQCQSSGGGARAGCRNAGPWRGTEPRAGALAAVEAQEAPRLDVCPPPLRRRRRRGRW